MVKQFPAKETWGVTSIAGSSPVLSAFFLGRLLLVWVKVCKTGAFSVVGSIPTRLISLTLCNWLKTQMGGWCKWKHFGLQNRRSEFKSQSPRQILRA